MQVIETGPRTIVVHAVVRTPNLAPNGPYPPAEMQVGRAVSRYLLARRCSDGELHLEPTDGWWNPRVKSTLLSVDGQQRPAETLVCTAVAAEFMVRMGSLSLPVKTPFYRFRRGSSYTSPLRCCHFSTCCLKISSRR